MGLNLRRADYKKSILTSPPERCAISYKSGNGISRYKCKFFVQVKQSLKVIWKYGSLIYIKEQFVQQIFLNKNNDNLWRQIYLFLSWGSTWRNQGKHVESLQ